MIAKWMIKKPLTLPLSPAGEREGVRG
jgi:hypothetical protein